MLIVSGSYWITNLILASDLRQVQSGLCRQLRLVLQLGWLPIGYARAYCQTLARA